MAEYDDLPYIVVERRSAGIGPFLWGALLGAGAALLLAPRSGQETRREIANGVRRLRDAAEDTVRQVGEAVTDTIDDLRGQVTDRVAAARQAMDAGREAARRTREDLERRVREARGEGSVPGPGGPPGESELVEMELLEDDEFHS